MDRVLILLDSLGALSSIADPLSRSVSSYLVFKIAHHLAGMMDEGRVVEFLWIPSHMGIIGNEVIDCFRKFTVIILHRLKRVNTGVRHFKSGDFVTKDKEHPGHPKKIEDEELEKLLDEAHALYLVG